MTTIVIDGKSKTVYADDMGTGNHTHTFSKNLSLTKHEWVSYIGEQTKIRIPEDHEKWVITGSGSRDTLDTFADVYPRAIPTPDKSTLNTNVFVVMPKNDGLQVVRYNTKIVGKIFKRAKWVHETHILNSGFIVSGSGSDYAYGALMAGVSPEEAIIAASKVDPFTSGVVQSYTFK